MKDISDYEHGCLICRGKGKILVTYQGQLELPVDCNSCDGVGRVGKITFMNQLKHPMMRNINNLEILELYENSK